jgi:hypothetical protein
VPLEVRYVTTITSDPILDIQDRVELGTFDRRIALLRGVAWLIAPLPLLLWTVGTLRAARRPIASGEASALDWRPDTDAPFAPPPTVAQAREALIRRLREPAMSADPLDATKLVAYQRDVVIALRSYLLAEVPSLNPGDTAREIHQHVETIAGDSHRLGVLKQLAARLVAYQSALERGVPVPVSDASADRRAIEILIRSLGWRGRIFRAIPPRMRP